MASLGHTGKIRVVLGHILNTQTLSKTDEQKKKGFKYIYGIVLGRIHWPQVGHPWWPSYVAANLNGELALPLNSLRMLRSGRLCVGSSVPTRDLLGDFKHPGTKVQQPPFEEKAEKAL